MTERLCLLSVCIVALDDNRLACDLSFCFLLMQAAACKNALVMEYETALQKAALDHKKAEETIKIKEAELEMVKKEKLDKVKELTAERSRYSRER